MKNLYENNQNYEMMPVRLSILRPIHKRKFRLVAKSTLGFEPSEFLPLSLVCL